MKIQTVSLVAGTPACNGKCPYCVSRMTGTDERMFRKDGSYNQVNLEKTLKFGLLGGATSVLITGKGEPTLNPDMVGDYVFHAARAGYPLIELQTNGFNLFEQEIYLRDWVELGLNTVALSIVTEWWSDNEAVMGKKVELELLIEFLRKLGVTVRLCVICLKGFIDCPSNVVRLCQFAEKHDVGQISLTPVKVLEVSRSTLGEKNFEWSRKHELRPQEWKDICHYISSTPKVLSLMHGATVYSIGRVGVCVRECLTIRPDTEEIRQLIYYPSGLVTYDWVFDGAILLQGSKG